MSQHAGQSRNIEGRLEVHSDSIPMRTVGLRVLGVHHEKCKLCRNIGHFRRYPHETCPKSMKSKMGYQGFVSFPLAVRSIVKNTACIRQTI
jgi:hypothetical protein